MRNYNLVIDIGNSNIVFGIYSYKELKFLWRINTDKSKTEDEYFAVLKAHLNSISVELGEIKNIALSSVIPELIRIFPSLIKKYFKCTFTNVNARTDLGLKFPMENPDFIGADLIVDAFIAKEKYKTNCIICDFGTATTIQLVGEDGYFYGTVIAPGIKTSADSLFFKTAQLSKIELQTPKSILGTSTKDALLSGIIKGSTFMIDGIIRQIKKEFNNLENIKVIATGGLAHLISEDSEEIEIIDENLTLDGLNLICLRYKNFGIEINE